MDEVKLSWQQWVNVWCIHARVPALAFHKFFEDFPTGIDPLASVEWMYEHNIFRDADRSEETQKRIVEEAASRMAMHVVEYMHPRVKEFLDARSWDLAMFRAAMLVLKTKSVTGEDMESLKRLIDIRDKIDGGKDIPVHRYFMSAFKGVLDYNPNPEMLQWWQKQRRLQA